MLSSRSWSGIFAAHPWLDGPADTYGYMEQGGGALMNILVIYGNICNNLFRKNKQERSSIQRSNFLVTKQPINTSN